MSTASAIHRFTAALAAIDAPISLPGGGNIAWGFDDDLYFAHVGGDRVLRYAFDAATGAFAAPTVFIAAGANGIDSPADLLFAGTPVPEPATLSLLGVVAAGMAWRRRRPGARG